MTQSEVACRGGGTGPACSPRIGSWYLPPLQKARDVRDQAVSSPRTCPAGTVTARSFAAVPVRRGIRGLTLRDKVV
jgi:hypothetical protein